MKKLVEFARKDLGRFLLIVWVISMIIAWLVICLMSRELCLKVWESWQDFFLHEAIKERLRQWEWRPQPIEPLLQSGCFVGAQPSWVQRLREWWERR